MSLNLRLSQTRSNWLNEHDGLDSTWLTHEVHESLYIVHHKVIYSLTIDLLCFIVLNSWTALRFISFGSFLSHRPSHHGFLDGMFMDFPLWTSHFWVPPWPRWPPIFVGSPRPGAKPRAPRAQRAPGMEGDCHGKKNGTWWGNDILFTMIFWISRGSVTLKSNGFENYIFSMKLLSNESQP